MPRKLYSAIDQISRERGIPHEVLLNVLEVALLSAVRKKFGDRNNVRVRIDPKTCDIQVFEAKQIVENVSKGDKEIALEEAKEIFPDKITGDTVEIPIHLHDLGRIASQTAKQVLLQKVREAEKDIIYEEFKDKVGQIVSGTVLRKERGNYYINLAKIEAVLPQKDTRPTETLRRGDIVKAYLSEVEQTPKGPVIMLSRTTTDFVIGLFKIEIPEIQEEIVVIKEIAREPWERTKLAVYSHDPSIDAVGACVGMKGTRVQSVVRELRGERIDIIPWSDDPRIFIARSLTPAVVNRVGINEEEKTAMVIADDQQLSLAIGRYGQNIKLASKLTGWEIEILSESEYSKIKIEEADRTLSEAIKEEATDNI
ncbi:transcription termination factor NusA [Thermodesulfovibrionales bacterium]|nr:transcription termination factor NusA [Thermodesulfovibrionales bacterium]